MISFQKRFLFVHIPKTGGNSIQSVLARYSEDELVRQRPGQDGIERFGIRSQYNLHKHARLIEYRDALSDRFDELFKFTCVRNPWERMLSLYFTPGQGRKWDRRAFEKMLRKTPSAADYLRLSGDDIDPFKNVNRILRFENLATEFASLCRDIQVTPVPLPHYNRSEREKYVKYYDADLRDWVAELFGEEIARFGYRFKSGG